MIFQKAKEVSIILLGGFMDKEIIYYKYDDVTVTNYQIKTKDTTYMIDNILGVELKGNFSNRILALGYFTLGSVSILWMVKEFNQLNLLHFGIGGFLILLSFYGLYALIIGFSEVSILAQSRQIFIALDYTYQMRELKKAIDKALLSSKA
jgi:hypothetical protein